jgi:hypothetical protein
MRNETTATTECYRARVRSEEAMKNVFATLNQRQLVVVK